MQVLAVVAPTVVEYVPAPQSVHVEDTEAPVRVEYLPASQLSQKDCPVKG
jgi:hypothetical protein